MSCPTCGRTEANVEWLAQAVSERLEKIKKPIRVAVMGCAVNGPGEARDADIGIACGNKRGILFKKGEKIGVVDEKDLVDTLMAEVEKL